MLTLQGKGVFGGIAIGKIKAYIKRDNKIKRKKIKDVKAEVERFYIAKQEAEGELEKLYEKALKSVGEENAEIFSIHQMMLNDLDYLESVENIIRGQEVNAEFAVARTSDNFSEMFSAMDDEYMRERASDVKDISDRVLKKLYGENDLAQLIDEPSIIFAKDLAPSETLQLNKTLVLGFVTLEGSTNSHTAILARTMNIGAVVDVGEIELEKLNGKLAIVDGFSGKVYIEPNKELLEEMRAKQVEEENKNKLLNSFIGKESKTADGKKIMLYANVGNPSDIDFANKNDAEGVGLFRSEFIYLQADSYPSEEEQFQIYRKAVEAMGDKRVIIRTLDIGADKKIDYFNLPKEENPALGYRAIRICLDRKEIFKTQLKALYRASAYGKLAIMLPMIISLEEVKKAKEIIEEVKLELTRENISFNPNLELGIMIETPASVMISDILSKEVDFFSIGTNDLTQYCLAIDRQNSSLEGYYDPHHKAIFRMIKMVCDNAHKNNIWVGICGELGADLSLTESLLALGVDELSVSAGAILPLRKKISETNIEMIRDKILEEI